MEVGTPVGIVAQKKALFDYWNEQKIVVHKRMTSEIATELGRALKNYSFEELKAAIDFYTTILEPGKKEDEKDYFWSYKWNLYEFLRRGVKKFDGQDTNNYRRKQKVDAPQAVVFKRRV